jgi:hypothetical protein
MTIYFSFTSLNLSPISFKLFFIGDSIVANAAQVNNSSTSLSNSSSPPTPAAAQKLSSNQTAAANTVSTRIVILIVLMGIFMVLLFFPSLKTIKVGRVELTTSSESIIATTGDVKQEPLPKI